jgi:hypothetical protein
VYSAKKVGQQAVKLTADKPVRKSWVYRWTGIKKKDFEFTKKT